ncbi:MULTISPECIES: alpha/beta hydrolase [Halolamina]|uniref:Phospholipase/carboxylesterase n=1 Tax=Halolamina pelagica TaxID=699431 RepID=A0A1I5NQR6_9EURY|nr:MULTISPECIES: dienelactone hydrolase family protein [Halolamina]NHX36429.1 phospholipase [Halolamina sp. R1-12]SFP24010.1 phospholipase/carboxylesterase [Halolamina pelagica]
MTDGLTVGGDGPHAGQPIETAGAPKRAAETAIVLLHGRGARPGSMLDLADELGRSGVAYVAPEAYHNTWYPNSFMADRQANQSHLDSALRAVDDAVGVALDAGIPLGKVLVGGFSQGACLASEYVYRNPERYGGLAALSGGLIGADGTTWPDAADASLEGTPAFFGCDDTDPHIPESRVHESAAAYRERGADVTERLYDDLGHQVNDDEMAWIRETLDDLLD